MSRRKRTPSAQGGDGPATDAEFSQHDYHHPAAGWGAAISVGKVLARERALLSGPRAILKMNHENGGSTAPAAPGPTISRACASTSARTASSTSPGR